METAHGPFVLCSARSRNFPRQILRLPRPDRPPHTGFSLVELIIAIAILSVGLIGALRVFPIGLRASQRAEAGSRAAMAAQRAIESLKLKTWNELPGAPASFTEEGLRVGLRFSRPAGPRLADPDRLRMAEVTVQASDGRGRAYLFVTYLRRH